MSLERFRRSSRGYRQILTSNDVRKDLERRANNVREAAQPNSALDLSVDSDVGRERATATVYAVLMAQEQKHRVLGSAMDAASL